MLETIGQYKILERVGAGALGELYRARDTRHGRTASIIVIAPEIAGEMLKRQQASAVVAARQLIVEGAVGMVDHALQMLSEQQIVELDEERKAAMVSNLLVVLCGERAATPVLNAGTLHQ